MKTATLPPLRVEPALRKAVERLLVPGETLSAFVEQAIRSTVEQRLADAAFAKKALASGAEAQATGVYHSAASVLRDLQAQTEPIRRRPEEGPREMKRYEVRFTAASRDDLLRLHRVLAERSPAAAASGQETIAQALEMLSRFPWSCRNSTAVRGSRYREMVITFGASGYVALFEIEAEAVTVLAVRHQRESDFR
jgi:plasmid stabilization system protein ParE